MNRYIPFTLLTIGIGLFLFSITLEPFTNRTEFLEQTSLIIEDENRFQLFHELRTSYLTPKYALENYGLILIILGSFWLILIPRQWKYFKTPNHKSSIVFIGVLAVLLTIGGFVGDLFLEMARDRYPPWSDSIGIPLMSTPVIFLIFSLWLGINLIGLKSPFKTSVSITKFNLRSTNYWYLMLIVLTILVTLSLIIEGDFWWTAAGLMWIYFYLTLMLGRQKERQVV